MEYINKHQTECLLILMEECAEVIQSASKIKRFGLVGKRVDSTLTNLQNLELELGDVLALVDMVIMSDLGITKEGVDIARKHKMERLSKYMHTWGDSSGI